MNKVLVFLKNRWKYVLTAVIALMIGSTFGPSNDELASALNDKADLNSQVKDKNSTIKEKEAKIKDLQAKVDEAAPWFKMKEEERKKKEAEAKAEAEKRLAAEKAKKEAEAKAKAKAEAEARAKAEAEEKKGYETGITYDQLARTPDDYIGKKVKFHGKVVQVIEGDDTTQIRLAVNDDYDKIIFAEFDKYAVSQRVLEDDKITIFGLSSGLVTYQSTMGGQISIPGVSIDKIEM
ncbi:toxin regulator [Bacillus massilinigeriensis]|uniref:toxin regulator n=1 Tax=Bacillus massilionigeriensis TaxID=1805475 RepID=UPI00096B0CB2|nr:toxin regulator [Bacillus massilionigeriensis]